MGIDESTGSDGEVFPDLLEQVEEDIDCVSADGAYDIRACYDALDQREAKANIPPRKNAVLAHHGNCTSKPLTRDENIRAIRSLGRKKWKKSIGYHRRSLAETAVFRVKKLFSGTLSTRLFDNQIAETIIRCKAMNKMTQLGMPESIPI